MEHITPRPFAGPEKAARKVLEIANATEALRDGRIRIEKINGPFLFKEDGTPEEYNRAKARHRARMAIEARVGNVREVHQSGADLLA
jgi:hypothetical protein